MPLDLVTIPCLADNYAFLLHDSVTGDTALIDIPEAAPISGELAARGWRLSEIWITHHHPDHIQGLGDLAEAAGLPVTGAAADAHRLPPLDRRVGDGDRFNFCGHEVQVMDVSGHTLGHIAFYVPDAQAVFTADSLMAMGCGRLFEGTPAQMWDSLSRLAALPSDTLVCSGHEYTEANARFAETIDPGNPALATRIADIRAKRAEGRPTVPSRLADEIATNPFLRATSGEVKAGLGLALATDVEVFAEIRARKDRF